MELDVNQKASLFDEALNDKEIRNKVLRTLSKKHPEVVVPELAAEDLVNERTAGIEKEFKDYREANEKRFALNTLEKERGDIAAKYNFSAEDMKKVEEIMTSKKIADYGSAAEFLSMSKQTATPAPSMLETRTMSLPDKAGEWFKNPIQTARKEATAALNEIRQRRERAA